MTTQPVYIYDGEGGTVQTTVKLPLEASETMVRLIADDGMELINGDERTTCIDVTENEVKNWSENPV